MEANRLREINDELKDYINESKFVSNKCRNKVIRMFSDSFNLNIPSSDYSTYDNAFLELEDNGKLKMRNKEYGNDISDEVLEKYYADFKNKADGLLSKKDLSFEKLNTFGNIINLILVLLIFSVIIGLTLFTIKAILDGDIYFSFWFAIFILPRIIPGLKDILDARINQARIYFKRLMKKIRK